MNTLFINNSKYKRICFYTFLFFFAFVIGLNFYDQINLPFSNPWGVTGPLTVQQYNPTNNVIRFIFLITIPSIFLVSCSLNRFANNLWIKEAQHGNQLETFTRNNNMSKIILYVLIVIVLIVVSGTLHRIGPLDTFHEGETLGTAIDYIYGKVPYKETIFVHGMFQDPLRSFLAFKVFGQSIAALRILESILTVTTLISFCVALYFLYASNIYYASIAILSLLYINLITPIGAGFRIPPRDVMLYFFLIVATFIYKYIITGHSNQHKFKIHFLLFLFAFIPALAFTYSIDRGFFLSVTSIFELVVIYFFFLKKQSYKYMLSILFGYVVGLIILGVTIKWAYYDFFKFIFVIMPQYKELMDGYIYTFDKIEYLIPVFLIALNLYWLTYRFFSLNVSIKDRFFEKIKLFYTYYFIEILLLILSVSYFRYALGRSGIPHIAFASTPIFILTSYVLIKHIISPFFNNKQYGMFLYLTASIILSVVLMFNFVQKIDFKQWYKFPIGVPDKEFIPPNYHRTISFLKENLNSQENFYTMTSEASWFYFINKPCPTRFPVVWFGMPYFYQREIVKGLQKNNVKFIIYRNNNWSNKIDGFSNELRLPIVVDYIKQNYVFFKKIDDNELWINVNDAANIKQINKL